MAKLGLPSINIIFKTTAAASIQRSEKGIVAMILRGTAEGEFRLTNVTDPVEGIDAASTAYITRCWKGYINPPRRILVKVMKPDGVIADALRWAENKDFDYLVLPPDASKEDQETTALWIKSMRAEGKKYKAVLANHAADDDGIINFCATGIKVGDESFTAGQYCSRIAGLIAGTPMTIACTYAPMFIGDLKEAVLLFDRKRITIDSSTVAADAWTTDQTVWRALERLDVIGKDSKAYVYGQIDVTAP